MEELKFTRCSKCGRKLHEGDRVTFFPSNSSLIFCEFCLVPANVERAVPPYEFYDVEPDSFEMHGFTIRKSDGTGSALGDASPTDLEIGKGKIYYSVCFKKELKTWDFLSRFISPEHAICWVEGYTFCQENKNFHELCLSMADFPPMGAPCKDR